MPLKERLFTPGPTEIPLRIIKAMEIASLHHRTDAFKTIFKDALALASELLESSSPPIFLACSGTGAMEAVIANLCKPEDTVAVITAGAFGDRWTHIAQRLGLKTTKLEAEWGSSPELKQVEEFLKSLPEGSLLCIQHCETSTTVEHPLNQIISLQSKVRPDLFTIIDGISAFATTPLPQPREKVDAYVVGSQKGLMLPPGLSIVSLSDRAWKKIEAITPRTLYFDLKIEREAISDGGTAWTPATTLIAGFVESARMLKEEGLANVYARHLRLKNACCKAISAMGLELLAPKFPAAGATGFFTPKDIDAEILRKSVKDQFGVRLTGGQGKLKGKIIRIGHMGWVDELDLIAVISALELCLVKMGKSAILGLGTKAALDVFASETK